MEQESNDQDNLVLSEGDQLIKILEVLGMPSVSDLKFLENQSNKV